MTARILRFFLAALLLGLLAGPYLYDQLDDLFITLAFAHRWADTSALTWGTGEAVEGYSNPLLLGALTLAVRLGLDGAAAAKGIAIASALGILALASARLPDDRRGHLGVLALALWCPLAYWGANGLETAQYAFLLASGWVLVCPDDRPDRRARWAAGVGILLLAAMSRHEGSLFLLVGLGLRGRAPPDRYDGAAILAILGFLGFHGARLVHFGSLLPAPYLVKIGGTHAGRNGAHQLANDALAGAGLVVCAAALTRPTLIALLPAAVGAAELIRANGDWMGFGRMTLPGLLASFLVCFRSDRLRDPPGWAFLPLLLAVVFAGVWEPHAPAGRGARGREFSKVLNVQKNLKDPWLTPFHGDLAFAVESLPDGARVEVADVGLIGNVPGLKIYDAVGLVDRVRAENVAYGKHKDAMAARHAPGPGQLDCVRRVSYDSRGGRPAIEQEILDAFPVEREVRYGSVFAIWRCVPLDPPSPERVAERWRELYRRYPSQAFLKERATRDFAATHPFQEGRGYPMYWAQTLLSRPFARAELQGRVIALDVDDADVGGLPVGIGYEPACVEDRELIVRERTEIPIEIPPCVPDGPVRIRVTLHPHEDPPGRDRNLYAQIPERGSSW